MNVALPLRGGEDVARSWWGLGGHCATLPQVRIVPEADMIWIPPPSMERWANQSIVVPGCNTMYHQHLGEEQIL